MRVRNIDQDPDSLHQRIIADDDLGFTQAIIAQRQGCAQSTVSQVLAAERLRRLRAELGRDADGSDGPETSVRAVHAAEQVREALAYVRAVEKRLMAVQRLLVADVAADATRNRLQVPAFGVDAEIAEGELLLDVLEGVGVFIVGACRTGVCGSCKCKVEGGAVNSTSTVPLTPDEVAAGVVLACSTTVQGEVRVSLA